MRRMLFQAQITRVSSMSLCFPSLPFGICWLSASLLVPKILWLSRLSGVLLATAVFLASYHEPLLDANTTTNIVNSFHSAPLRLRSCTNSQSAQICASKMSPARQKIAGILCVFQDFLTRPAAFLAAKMCAWAIGTASKFSVRFSALYLFLFVVFPCSARQNELFLLDNDPGLDRKLRISFCQG